MTAPLGTIDIQIIGDDSGVQYMLRKLDTALNPAAMGAFLGGTIDPYIRARARSRFQSEGDDVVGKWIPLASATKTIRVQEGYGEGPINHRTGQLERYIVGSPRRIVIDPAAGATLVMPGDPPTGVLRDKVETAEEGLAKPRTPPRPVMGLNEKDLAFTLEALALYIQRGMTL